MLPVERRRLLLLVVVVLIGVARPFGLDAGANGVFVSGLAQAAPKDKAGGKDGAGAGNGGASGESSRSSAGGAASRGSSASSDAGSGRGSGTAGTGVSRSDRAGTGLTSPKPRSQPSGGVSVTGAAVEVKHSDGITEKLQNGRYEMRDGKGRIIISRKATAKDRARMRRMSSR